MAVSCERRAAPTTVTTAPPRTVHSYAARGRLTKSQRRALESLWPRYGVDTEIAPLNLEEVFGRRAPRCMEIGYGMGDALVTMATANPDRDYIGVEIYPPGIGSTLKKIDAARLCNVRLLWGDATQLISTVIPAASLETVYIFFPDPWPKKRHHKRRLVQPSLAHTLAARLAPGGQLHLATDWEDYAAHMLEVLGATPGLVNSAGAGSYAERPQARPLTKFEQRGQRLGHGVWDLVFRRV
jgi:tRNA (guanine-N7-)-methyltransferase